MPEVASRRHLELVSPVIRAALEDASTRLDDIDRVAVTQGPGLVGALLVGLSAAKALAWAGGLPLVPVDHLRGHVATLYLAPDPLDPPFTCLLASGGHTLVLSVRDRTGYEVLGSTLDDAAGEAFDKGARLLGLGYPGGAEIDRLARRGRPRGVLVPRGARSRPRPVVLGAEDGACSTRCATSPRPSSRRDGRTSPPHTSARSSARSSAGCALRPRRRGTRRSPSSAALPPTRSCAPRSPTRASRRSRSARTTRR